MSVIANTPSTGVIPAPEPVRLRLDGGDPSKALKRRTIDRSNHAETEPNHWLAWVPAFAGMTKWLGGIATTTAAHPLSVGVIPALMQRVRCIRSPAGTRPSRDHSALQKLGWVPSRDPTTCMHAIGDGMTVLRQVASYRVPHVALRP